MKFIKFITVFFFASVLLTSCEIEPVDSSSLPENGGGTSTGDYWPTAINNQWVFKMDGVLQSPMKMISINTISSNTYYTFNEIAATGIGSTISGVQRLRKLNGDYYIKMESLSSPAQGPIPGFTMTGYETIILKDYIPVGGTWTDKYSQTTTYTDPNFPVITLDFDIVATVMEKNSSITVAGRNYTDVIKIKYIQKVTMVGQTTVATSYYWYSKNVGPIKMTTETGGQTTVQELDSYIVK
ncbi:MAG TPA: hypothetical protein VN182_07400 [Flavobacterium sp.]|nr:hypothetical protein [Flavobacterium sp.]